MVGRSSGANNNARGIIRSVTSFCYKLVIKPLLMKPFKDNDLNIVFALH